MGANPGGRTIPDAAILTDSGLLTSTDTVRLAICDDGPSVAVRLSLAGNALALTADLRRLAARVRFWEQDGSGRPTSGAVKCGGRAR
jgi:hypothetical protein